MIKYFVKDCDSYYVPIQNIAVFDSPIPLRIGESISDYDGCVWQIKNIEYQIPSEDGKMSAYLLCYRA